MKNEPFLSHTQLKHDMITISLSYKTKNSFIEEKLILLINQSSFNMPHLTDTEDFVAVTLPRRLCLPGARLL